LKTVLVLDDVIDILNLLETILSQLDFEVVKGHNGVEGLTLLENRQRKPTLIMSNLMMPEMDGISFLQQVRQHPVFYDIPFVLVTADHSEGTVAWAFENGANGFLPKPFRVNDVKVLLKDIGVV
jgi:CheY-like chemotaxis protein